jgi:hypothetical protein
MQPGGGVVVTLGIAMQISLEHSEQQPQFNLKQTWSVLAGMLTVAVTVLPLHVALTVLYTSVPGLEVVVDPKGINLYLSEQHLVCPPSVNTNVLSPLEKLSDILMLVMLMTPGISSVKHKTMPPMEPLAVGFETRPPPTPPKPAFKTDPESATESNLP